MYDNDAATKGILSWRPKNFDDSVPNDVFDARMALLPAEDAKKLKADFVSGRDPVAVYLWFGGDMFGNAGANASATMTRCAYVGVDKETTMRLFLASGWAEGVSAEKLPDLLEEGMEFVGEFREEMSKMNRKSYPHMRFRYLTHGNYGGKDGM